MNCVFAFLVIVACCVAYASCVARPADHEATHLDTRSNKTASSQ